MAQTDSKLNGKTVLLGVTGGIAAYKAVDLASKLTQAGAKVLTVMTKNATRLVGAKSFEAVTGQCVFAKMWSSPAEFKITHINLAEGADIVVVAPATANIMAKMATGISDDLLSTTLCACWNKPGLIAPAMNNNMWSNPATQRNVEILKQSGYEFIGPARGRLACGTDAVGRMAEPAAILENVTQLAGRI